LKRAAYIEKLGENYQKVQSLKSEAELMLSDATQALGLESALQLDVEKYVDFL
jgi:phosphate uptake regulator